MYTRYALPNNVASTWVVLRRGLLIRTNEWTPTCRVKAGRSTARCREGISWISRGHTRFEENAIECKAMRGAHWFAAKKVTRTSVSIALLDSKEASAAKSCSTAHGNLPDTRRFVNVNVGGPRTCRNSVLPFCRSRNGIGSRRVHHVGPWITLLRLENVASSSSPDLSGCFANRHDRALISIEIATDLFDWGYNFLITCFNERVYKLQTAFFSFLMMFQQHFDVKHMFFITAKKIASTVCKL